MSTADNSFDTTVIDLTQSVILLVDDDEDCRMLVRDVIESSHKHVTVFECSDGVEGINFLKDHCEYDDKSRPCVVFLDLEMPHKNGLSMLQEMRQLPKLKDLPVVVLTGIDDDEQERMVMASGANSYTCKGQNADALIDRIANATCYWIQVHRKVG